MLATSPAWFDLAALAILAVTVMVGLRRGMSEELIPLVQWLTVCLVAGTNYKLPGDMLAAQWKIQPGLAYAICYLALTALIVGIFAIVRRVVGQKLIARHVFGALETPLGGLAGAGRGVCLLLVALAILNARYVSPEERERMNQPRTEEGALAAFTVESIQNEVFVRSRSGAFAQGNLGGLLLTSSPPVVYQQKKIEGFGKKMERAVNEQLEAFEKK